MKLFNKITIIGVGLIGGSIGLAVKNKKLAKQVTGFFRRKQSAQKAIRNKIVDCASFDLTQAVKDTDLVILATPVEAIKNISRRVVNSMKPGAILIDVGSTKKEIVGLLGKLAEKRDICFVGTHPLAGSEKSGLAFAKKNLFIQAICFITPDKGTNKEAILKIERFWKQLGAKVVLINPAIHDHILAQVSHLPHMIAFALINSVPDNHLKFSGSGLQDTTRLASSPADIWRDIALSNRKEILLSIKNFKENLIYLEGLINRKESRKLTHYFTKAKNRRDNL
jgi:prephenate dehydrogenase